MNDNRESNLAALLAGIIIGAAGAYLFTNPEGKKLKDKLLKEGQKMLSEIASDLSEAKDEIVENGPEEIRSTAQAAQKVVETAGEEIASAASEIPGQIEEIQKKGRRFFFHKHPSPPATES